MPTNQNDDDDSGSLKAWLNYKVGPVYGSVIVVVVFLLGAATRWL